MLTPLPDSPNGEITHGTHREKTNRIVEKVNELQTNIDKAFSNDAALFQVSNQTELSIPANTETRIMPSLVTAKMSQNDNIEDYLIIDTANNSFSFKKDGKAANLKAFELYVHVIGSGQWGNSSYVTIKREGDPNPISAGVSTAGANLMISASTDSYLLDYYDENNDFVDIRDDKFYIEIFADGAKTVAPRGFKIRIRFIVQDNILWDDE